jgi:hypothetical protein
MQVMRWFAKLHSAAPARCAAGALRSAQLRITALAVVERETELFHGRAVHPVEQKQDQRRLFANKYFVVFFFLVV